MMNRNMISVGAMIAAIALAAVVLSYPATKALAQANKQVMVEIVKGATTMGSKALSMNPIQIERGTTVVWKNNDAAPHHLISGKGMGDTDKGKLFDSGSIAAGKTFSHKFDTPGTFDFFDALHPTIVGKVVVK